MLGRGASFRDSNAFFAVCRQTWESWKSSWDLHISELQVFSSDLAPWLKLCGRLYHSQTGILLHRASGGTIVPQSEAQAVAGIFVTTIADLFVNQDCFAVSSFSDEGPTATYRLHFPLFWTMTHTLFSAGLILIDAACVLEKEVESCVWLLTCMEMDRGNLCDGFANTLRRLSQARRCLQNARS